MQFFSTIVKWSFTLKLICDTNFFYQEWEDALKVAQLKPSPTLGNCTELLLHWSLSVKNLRARRSVKCYLDNLVSTLPYDELRSFLSEHSIKCTVPVLDNARLLEIFLEDEDYLLNKDLLEEVKRQHLCGLAKNGVKVRELSEGYYDWVEKQIGHPYADLPASKKVFDAIHLFVLLYSYSQYLSITLYRNFFQRFGIFSSIWFQKVESMRKNKQEKLKQNDFYDLLQFLYLKENDFYITGEKTLQNYLNQTKSSLLLEGPANLKLYQVRS